MSTGGNKDTLLTRLSKRGQLAGKKTGSGSVAATTTEKLSERNGIFASLSLLLHGDGERSGEEGHSSGGACPAAATWGKSFAEGQNTSQRMKEQENEHTNRSASFCNQTTPLSLAARPRSKSIHVSTGTYHLDARIRCRASRPRSTKKKKSPLISRVETN
jgi:hypothetical protein